MKRFGENKVQEAVSKWEVIKQQNNNIKLHMVGKLQSNKAKTAFKSLIIFIPWTTES